MKATKVNKAELAARFAKKLIQEGEQPGVAIYKAANYHRVPASEVANCLGTLEKEPPNKPNKQPQQS